MERENPPIYRRMLSGFAWQGTSKLLVQLISWVSTVVVARLLAPADYGVMAIGGVFLTILTLLMEMGLSQALIQKSTVSEEEEDAVFWMSLVLGGALFLTLFFAAPFIAEFYQIGVLSPLLQVCGIGIVISSLKTVPQAILMRRLDFRSRALVEVWASLAATSTVITLAMNGWGVWSLAWGLIVQQTVTSIGFLPAMKRWPQLRFRLARISGMLRFSFHLTGSNLAFVVSRGADVFIIGKVLGPHFSGVYSLASQLATLPLDKIGTVFNHVAFAGLSRVKDDEAEARTLFVELHRYLLFVSYPVLIGLAVVARDLVALLFGDKWVQVVPVLQMLCIVSVIRLSAMIMSPALVSRGDTKSTLKYSLSAAIVMPLSIVVGVQFGIEGVAMAWIAVYPFLYAILLRAISRNYGVTMTQLMTDSRPTMLATMVMVVAVLATQYSLGSVGHGSRLGACIVAGVAAYVGVFLLFYKEQVVKMRMALRALRSEGSA